MSQNDATPTGSPFPGGGKIVALLFAVVLLVAFLVKFPGMGSSEPPVNQLLASLGEGTDLALNDLEAELGGPRGAGGTDTDLEDPLDLSVLPGEEDFEVPSEVTRLDPPDSEGGLELPDEIPAALPPLASNPGETGPEASSDAGRSVDASALFAAQKAGDHPYLVSVVRDPSYKLSGRVLALTLSSLISAPQIDTQLYEIFESQEEPFALRESAVYALLSRNPGEFPVYMTRVLARPQVRDGSDSKMARLITLGFYSDRWMDQGAALDRVSGAVMEQARMGSKVALGVLSFALRADRPQPETEKLLTGAPGQPIVSSNLIKFYKQMLSRGREEYRAPLKRLESLAEAP